MITINKNYIFNLILKFKKKMNISRKTKYQNLTKEEQNLLNLYLNEYEEMFQFILIQPQNEFIDNIIKRVELSLKKKLTTSR